MTHLFRSIDAIHLALVCREGHEHKLERLHAQLPHRYQADVLTEAQAHALGAVGLSRYDILFFKSKDDALLELMRALEARRTTHVINPVDAVVLTKHRQRAAQAIAREGVPVPLDYLGPLSGVPFERFVIKGEFEDDPMLPEKIDGRAAHEALMRVRDASSRVYAQAFVDSAWEHKMYCAAGEVFAFRQSPTLINPDKQATRQVTQVDPQLAEYTLQVMKATGLELVGVDFLIDEGQPRVTDINSIQGLQNFDAGCQALIRYFDRCASAANAA